MNKKPDTINLLKSRLIDGNELKKRKRKLFIRLILNVLGILLFITTCILAHCWFGPKLLILLILLITSYHWTEYK